MTSSQAVGDISGLVEALGTQRAVVLVLWVCSDPFRCGGRF